MNGSTATGFLDLTPGTGLPYELDETFSSQPPMGGNLTTRSKMIWSRFNDPSLRIPSSPISS